MKSCTYSGFCPLSAANPSAVCGEAIRQLRRQLSAFRGIVRQTRQKLSTNHAASAKTNRPLTAA